MEHDGNSGNNHYCSPLNNPEISGKETEGTGAQRKN